MNKKLKSSLLAISLFSVASTSAGHDHLNDLMNIGDVFDNEIAPTFSFEKKLLAINGHYSLLIDSLEEVRELYLKMDTELITHHKELFAANIGEGENINKIAAAAISDPLLKRMTQSLDESVEKLPIVRDLRLKQQREILDFRKRFKRQHGLQKLREEELKIKINHLPAVVDLWCEFNMTVRVILSGMGFDFYDLDGPEATARFVEKIVEEVPELREMQKEVRKKIDELPEVIRLREEFSST